MSNTDASDAQALRTSFLDVVSCGLGGAVLLGLVFSVVRHSPPVQTSAPPFIAVEFDVTTPVPELIPLINVWVKPPGCSPFVVDLYDFNLKTGEPLPVAERRNPSDPIDNFQLIGFSPEGKQPLNAAGGPVYLLYVDQPEPGAWAFKARYSDHYHAFDQPSVPLAYALKDQVIQVRTTAMVRDRSVRMSKKMSGAASDYESIHFGQLAARGDSVVVSPY